MLCRKRVRDKVDALPEMRRLKEDPSLCEPSMHPPRTSQDDIDSMGTDDEPPAPDRPRHPVSDSFHSLPANETPSSRQQVRHRSPHRQRSMIQPPTSHESQHESASHHESSAQRQDHSKEEWDQAFG